MPPFPIAISHYRSIVDPLVLPFGRKVTFLAGPNNVGKSNAIKALAIIANNSPSSIQPGDHLGAPGVQYTMSIPIEFIRNRFSGMANATSALSVKSDDLKLQYSCHAGGVDLAANSLANVAEYFSSWLRGGHFLNEMGQSGPGATNANLIVNRLNPLDTFSGSTHLPHLRFITTQGNEPPRYLGASVPGETISFGTVISRLAEMDRPVPSQRHLQGNLRKIEEFMEFCLESKSVKIEVSFDRTAVTVDVDGEQRSLGDLGTGLEQLMMIGLASMGFPGKLVLIDEPELHLHPRAQKRMMLYLANHVDAHFVIATHSAAVLDSVDADIVHISRVGTGSQSRTISSNSDRYRAVRDLGHSPSELVLSRFAIWIEGPSDRIYIKNWIQAIDPSLIEGVDYSFLFYGGSNLAQHSYEDADEPAFPDEVAMENDLLPALAFSREFAVVIDSDIHPAKPDLRATKKRVRDETVRMGGLCWITDGREIENYISLDTQRALADEFSYATIASDKSSQILNPRKASKVDFAKRAVELFEDEWPLDLREKVEELVRRIVNAR